MFLKRFLIFLLSSAFFLLGSCSGSSNGPSFEIGVDPSWYPIDLMGKEANVYAFSNDLLQEIARVKKIQISRINMNWDNLFLNLEKNKYQGILSSLYPYLFNKKHYDFSEIYLAIGPVLILSVSSSANSFKMLRGKEIAVLRGSNNDLILEKYPDTLIRTYDSIPKALNDIVSGTIDGALIDVLIAESYIHDLYQGQLKIATAPLTNEGLRLVTLRGQQEELIRLFNEGLDELKKDGSYDKLLSKWGMKGSPSIPN